MSMQQSQSEPILTQADLIQIKEIFDKAVKVSGKGRLKKEYLDLLNMMVEVMHELRITVEFDHEQRIRALEDYLLER